jgi:hypothetical protein
MSDAHLVGGLESLLYLIGLLRVIDHIHHSIRERLHREAGTLAPPSGQLRTLQDHRRAVIRTWGSWGTTILRFLVLSRTPLHASKQVQRQA